MRPLADRIEVDRPIRSAASNGHGFWLYHKPGGLVTTNADPEGRPTVFENLPEDLPRGSVVGPPGHHTEGLLLLTNDGGLARVLELPSDRLAAPLPRAGTGKSIRRRSTV